MLIQRTIPITLEKSPELLETIEEFNQYQKRISGDCFSEGNPKNALSLHKLVYHKVDSSLTSQLKCSAIRLVAGAYASAKSNKRPRVTNRAERDGLAIAFVDPSYTSQICNQ